MWTLSAPGMQRDGTLRGVSGISCAAGRFKRSDQGGCEALAEQDDELGLGHGPRARWHDPCLLGAVQGQEEKFRRRLVAGEMASGPDHSAQLGIQASIAFVVYKIRLILGTSSCRDQHSNPSVVLAVVRRNWAGHRLYSSLDESLGSTHMRSWGIMPTFSTSRSHQRG
jgi:hypothetical protein